MTNAELKRKIKDNGFTQWQVALAVGITEMSLIRWLREPERKERVERVAAAIDSLKGAAKNG